MIHFLSNGAQNGDIMLVVDAGGGTTVRHP